MSRTVWSGHWHKSLRRWTSDLQSERGVLRCWIRVASRKTGPTRPGRGEPSAGRRHPSGEENSVNRLRRVGKRSHGLAHEQATKGLIPASPSKPIARHESLREQRPAVDGDEEQQLEGQTHLRVAQHLHPKSEQDV